MIATRFNPIKVMRIAWNQFLATKCRDRIATLMSDKRRARRRRSPYHFRLAHFLIANESARLAAFERQIAILKKIA